VPRIDLNLPICFLIALRPGQLQASYDHVMELVTLCAERSKAIARVWAAVDLPAPGTPDTIQTVETADTLKSSGRSAVHSRPCVGGPGVLPLMLPPVRVGIRQFIPAEQRRPQLDRVRRHQPGGMDRAQGGRGLPACGVHRPRQRRGPPRRPSEGLRRAHRWQRQRQAVPLQEQIAKRLQSTDPSGSDPKPYLKQLRIPALWLYGTADREVPVDQSVALLNTLKSQGKDFTVVTFPDAGHGLLDSPPTAPQAPKIFVEWVEKRVHTEAKRS
jgi:pimeloyl-ACP methyl ester carboxylesterase